MKIRIIAMMGFLLGACTPQPTQNFPSADAITVPSATAEIGTDQIQSAAIADLSNRLSLEPKLIRVISVESRLWPDASLGCPQPGMQYAQATVPGYLLQLEANGQEFEYHSDIDETTILCGSTLEETSSENGTDQNLDDGWPNESRDNEVLFVTPSKNP